MKVTLKNGQVVRFGYRVDNNDARDFRYAAPPQPLPEEVDNRSKVVRIMNQGSEGSCTGHAVCACAEFLYGHKFRGIDLSQRWCYRRARENDPWPGENYHGSTCRAAIEGWFKYGICEEGFWPYKSYHISEDEPNFDLLQWEGSPVTGADSNAMKYPLQSYIRCNSLYDIKHALHYNGVVVVGASIHSGWNLNGSETIQYAHNVYEWSGHAFILVGYNEQSQVFYVANSWGTNWGKDGFAKYTYKDASDNIRDAWVITIPKKSPIIIPDENVRIEVAPNLGLPDNGQRGIIHSQRINKTGKVAHLSVWVDIEHPHISDLQVILMSPDNRRVVLFDREDAGANLELSQKT